MIRTNEQFVASMKVINPNIMLLGEYVKSRESIKCKCSIDGYEWYGLPMNLLRGVGCPMCGGKVGSSPEKMSKTLEEIGFNIISLSDSLVSCKMYSSFRCLDCGNVWNEQFRNFKRRNYGCPECRALSKYEKARQKMMPEIASIPSIQTTEDYESALLLIDSNLCPVEDFVSISFPILHVCKKHNVDTKKSPVLVLSGEGCLECGIEKTSKFHRKSTEVYKEEAFEVNPQIEVLEDYSSIHTPILHRCKECGYEWRSMPSNFLRKGGCPHCSSSRGEMAIEKVLQRANIPYIAQYSFHGCKHKRSLFFDFYMPGMNTVIEYQGQQHYYPVTFGGLKDTQAENRFAEIILRDNIKRDFCRNEEIRLLEIPYWEFDNIESILQNELQIAC